MRSARRQKPDRSVDQLHLIPITANPLQQLPQRCTAPLIAFDIRFPALAYRMMDGALNLTPMRSASAVNPATTVIQLTRVVGCHARQRMIGKA